MNDEKIAADYKVQGRYPSSTAASNLLWEADERRENRGRLQSSRRLRLASCSRSERRQLKISSTVFLQFESFTSKQKPVTNFFGSRCRRTKEKEERTGGEERTRTKV